MNLVELVPRTLETVEADALDLLSHFSQINGINIPDVKRVPVRSHAVAKVFLKQGIFIVPHIRSMDFSTQSAITLFDELVSLGLSDVLIISGDVYPEYNNNTPLSALEMISLLKKRYPTLSVYAALDPYRNTANAELAYCHQKLDNGCDGFFSQPFFDIEHADWYLSRLRQTQVFVGISPVLTEKSKNYWTMRNHVQFSSQFKIDLDYNIRLAHDLMKIANAYTQHTYHMPITMDARDYAKALWL
jgi:methylenetetrahydrofolate reductase (NADPH)